MTKRSRLQSTARQESLPLLLQIRLSCKDRSFLYTFITIFFSARAESSLFFHLCLQSYDELQYGIDRSPVWYRLLSQCVVQRLTVGSLFLFLTLEDNCFLFLIIRLQLYGRAPVGYLNVLYKDGQQSITGNLMSHCW